MIRLLIVDDSALMRRLLSAMFSAEADIEVRTARNGREALQMNLAFEPHVITLDINMPEMDGLTALSHLMVQRPVPVVMLSSLTEKGALATFEALNLGAVDYLPKPDGTISLSIDTLRDAVIAKVRMAARARLKRSGATAPQGASQSASQDGAHSASRTASRIAARSLSRASSLAASHASSRGLLRTLSAMPRPEPSGSLPSASNRDGVVLIGASTGGPRTLETVLRGLPGHFPWPVLVAQHMPASFTGPFAQRLDQVCDLRVTEVSTLQLLKPGTVYIGRGGSDLQLVRRLSGLAVASKPENPAYLWHPSVELMGRSALQHLQASQILAVMLTGMGNDGADAFTEISARGGRTIAESEESAVVFGMPAELIRRGGAQQILQAQDIARQIGDWVEEMASDTAGDMSEDIESRNSQERATA